ncbi:MAG: NAD(P)-dependent oxidoreductase [Erythrobacter sp.]|nr:NAD(P)-dependent oxidoreductase [Erythrobacter sp.]
MRIVLTGSSGRVGRAIFAALCQAEGEAHEVIGIDRVPFSTTRVVADLADRASIERTLEGAGAVIHAAGPHAPHVGVVSDAEFAAINVEATRWLYESALAEGVSRFLYTSTTALYGHAVIEGACTWIDETTQPLPRTIYHRTKLAGEQALEALATARLPVRVLRMSRSFPEPAPAMAVYRLHRGVDVRDVASGHALALAHEGAPFERFILSGEPPFAPADCEALAKDAEAVLRAKAPALAAEFERRGWALPRTIDRVYSPAQAQTRLGWQMRHGWEEVLRQLDRASLEVLPAAARIAARPE